jgi:hypothetical protein
MKMSINPVEEKHYRVDELAKVWRFSRQSVIKLFRTEPGVLKLGSDKYVILSIPESVALRVHQRLGHQPLKTEFASTNSGTVIRFRDSNTGMVKKPGHILKLHRRGQK